MIQGDIAERLAVIAANVAVIAVVSVGIGASAPRWPRRWLLQDRGPLRLTKWDTAANYRRAGIPRLARALPEAGSAFGGVNKRTHPRRTRREIHNYLIEARRGEWVHWLAMTAVIPMIWYNPWWMWLAFLVTVIMVNGVFIAILRNARVRLYSKLAVMSDKPAQRNSARPPDA